MTDKRAFFYGSVFVTLTLAVFCYLKVSSVKILEGNKTAVVCLRVSAKATNLKLCLSIPRKVWFLTILVCLWKAQVKLMFQAKEY